MVKSSLNETYRDFSVQDVKWNTSENTENWLQDPDTGEDNRDAQAAWLGFFSHKQQFGQKIWTACFETRQDVWLEAVWTHRPAFVRLLTLYCAWHFIALS